MRIQIDEKREVELLMPADFQADKPLLILAHGAGNDMRSGFMETVTGHISEGGVNVLRFNFPYKVSGKKMPDHGPVLEDSWRAVINHAREALSTPATFIGGKSMGGRVAATVAREFGHIRGVVFLGYPLHPPGKFEHRRDESLHLLQKPMLFVQGTRDPLARMDLLQQTLSDIRDHATLHWVEGGDHSFQVLVRQGVYYPEVLKNVGTLVSEWIHQKATSAE